MKNRRSLTWLVVIHLLTTLLTPLLGGQAQAQNQRVVYCENPPAPAVVYDNGFSTGWRAGSWDSDVQIDPSSTVHVLPGKTSSFRAIVPGEFGGSGVEFSNPNYRSAGH